MADPLVEHTVEPTTDLWTHPYPSALACTNEAEAAFSTVDNMNDVSTAVPTYSFYPPSSMFGYIADHDRPYAEYGHLGM